MPGYFRMGNVIQQRERGARKRSQLEETERRTLKVSFTISIPNKILFFLNEYYSLRSPTHAEGLFAIDRDYFLKLEAYDPGLLVWGGENFELSFKVNST